MIEGVTLRGSLIKIIRIQFFFIGGLEKAISACLFDAPLRFLMALLFNYNFRELGVVGQPYSVRLGVRTKSKSSTCLIHRRFFSDVTFKYIYSDVAVVVNFDAV
jgi:hypothetical protein